MNTKLEFISRKVVEALIRKSRLDIKNMSFIFMQTMGIEDKNSNPSENLERHSEISLLETLNIEINYEGEIKNLESYDLIGLLNDMLYPKFEKKMQ